MKTLTFENHCQDAKIRISKICQLINSEIFECNISSKNFDDRLHSLFNLLYSELKLVELTETNDNFIVYCKFIKDRHFNYYQYINNMCNYDLYKIDIERLKTEPSIENLDSLFTEKKPFTTTIFNKYLPIFSKPVTNNHYLKTWTESESKFEPAILLDTTQNTKENDKL